MTKVNDRRSAALRCSREPSRGGPGMSAERYMVTTGLEDTRPAATISGPEWQSVESRSGEQRSDQNERQRLDSHVFPPE